MNSQWARDKAINLMSEEAKELTVDFLMNQLAIEDCNTQHKFLTQLNSSSSVNFAAYDHRQSKGKSNKSKCTSGKNGVQNNPGVQTSSNNNHPSRKNPQEWKDVESQSTSQARNVQPRMLSARSATKLDISIRYANLRKEAGEPI